MELISKHARYTILSHTWLQDGSEVTYQDFHDPVRFEAIRLARGEGYKKLEMFCDVSFREYSATFAWMDTICIDKHSSSELDESIRSMFNWYLFSTVCIVILTETTSDADMENDRWFTRGWTLQELLAPKVIKFYNKDWLAMSNNDNDKQVDWVFTPPNPPSPIERAIQRATGIDYSHLFYYTAKMSGNIAERMTWAAKRRTTRGEDIAYSLMGIFGVSISIAYGEGPERAFFRLLEAILSSSEDILDVLNCAGRPVAREIHTSRLIPSAPECYLKHIDFRTEVEKNSIMPREKMVYLPLKPVLLTHLGLRIRLLLVPTQLVWPEKSGTPRKDSVFEVKMRCLGPIWDNDPISFQMIFFDTDEYGDIPTPTYSTDVFSHFNPVVSHGTAALSYFGLYTFHEHGQQVELPRSSCAICLKIRVPRYPDGTTSLGDLSPRYIKWQNVVLTAEPIVVKRNSKQRGEEMQDGGLVVEKSFLAVHSMKLQTLYL